MNAASLISQQGFIAQFNSFVATEARIPMQPLRMRGEDVYLRAAGSLLTGDRISKAEWTRVEEALRNATGLFMELNADMESGRKATLAHAAGKIVAGA